MTPDPELLLVLSVLSVLLFLLGWTARSRREKQIRAERQKWGTVITRISRL